MIEVSKKTADTCIKPKAVTGDVRMIPFGQLRRSDDNVRTIKAGKSEDQRLLTSIKQFGLLQNLVVTQNEDGTYAVPAGGRRLGALEQLYKEGLITEDTEINCLITDAAIAVEASLAENEDRAAMHPADRYRAYKRMVADGQTVDIIALSYSTTPTQVQKILRLANVHPTIFKLFSADKIDYEEVASYAITSDTKRQVAVFKLLGVDARAWQIKRAITEGQEGSDSEIARYVTVKAYSDAGGVIEQDLLGEQAYLKDIELLNRLALDKLENAASREKGWKWIEVHLSSPSDLYAMKQISKSVKPLPNELTKQLEQAKSALAKLEDNELDDGDVWTDKMEAEFDKAYQRVGELEKTIEQKYTHYSSEDKLLAGVIVTVGRSGRTEFHRGLQKPADVRAARKVHTTTLTDGSELPDSGAVTGSGDLSAALVSDLLKIRRSAVKTALLNKPALAATVLNYALCTKVLESIHRWEPAIIDASFDVSEDETSIEGDRHFKSIEILDTRRGELDLSWMNHESRRARFEAFQTLPRASVQRLVAYCVSVTIVDGIHETNGTEALDAVVEQLGVDISSVWRPTDVNYFGRLTKAQLIEHGLVFYGDGFSRTHDKSKKAVLVTALHDFFHDSSVDVTFDQKRLRKEWVPKIML